MTHLSAFSPHPTLDDESQWGAELSPPFFDRQAFQERVSDICAPSRDGSPVIRLVWAPQVWTRLFGRDIPRYWTRRRKQGEDFIYHTVKRWVFERRLERAQYCDAWEASRANYRDPETNQIIDPGPPPDSFYVFAAVCAEHDPQLVAPTQAHACCERRFREARARCWGYYREPNEADLQMLARAVRERDAEPFVDPYAPLTPAQLRDCERVSNEQVEREEMEQSERDLQMLTDFARTHAWRLWETDAGRLRHGKYHFLTPRAPIPVGYSERPSGLVVPGAD